MSTTDPTIHNIENLPEPEGTEPFDIFKTDDHPGIIEIENGGERPPKNAIKLPTVNTKAHAEEVVEELSENIPEHPGDLAEQLKKPDTKTDNRKRNNIILGSIAAFALSTVSYLIYHATTSDSERAKATPTATSTPNPGASRAATPAATTTPTPTSTPNSSETTPNREVDITPHVTQKDIAANIDGDRVNALLATYPELANYLQLPSHAQVAATDAAIAHERQLVKKAFSDPAITAFIPKPEEGNEGDHQRWFTEDDITNATSKDSNAGIPVVAFPDFALRWAGFFTDAVDNDKLVNIAFLSPTDAAHYKKSIEGDGQVGHAVAVRSDTIGVVKTWDGKLFEGTVTEYAPGNNEATGRVYVRWSLILPVNGSIPGAPANADFGVRASEEYLGNAPAN